MNCNRWYTMHRCVCTPERSDNFLKFINVLKSLLGCIGLYIFFIKSWLISEAAYHGFIASSRRPGNTPLNSCKTHTVKCSTRRGFSQSCQLISPIAINRAIPIIFMYLIRTWVREFKEYCSSIWLLSWEESARVLGGKLNEMYPRYRTANW